MATSPDSLAAAISWNPGTQDRLLIAGDESSLPAIRTLVATLRGTDRGQVFVEVGSDSEIEPLVTPGRVTVCWLVRDRGQSLRRSVDAWLSEMLPVDLAHEHTVYAWIAGEGSAHALTSD